MVKNGKISGNKRKKLLTNFSTVEIGEVCFVEQCCREIRLGSNHGKIGDILSGFNTLSDEYEEWEIIKINQVNHWKNHVRRTK